MRTIDIFFEKASISELSKWLTGYCTFQGKDSPWLIKINDDPAIYINLSKGEEIIANYIEIDGFDAYKPMLDKFEHYPSVALTADISGRHDGTSEIYKLCTNVLKAFKGFALDEYTFHPWSLTELQDSTKIENHPFFDFNGWYKEYEKNA